MTQRRILGAALALAMVCAIPGSGALDIGGEAQAARADRGNSAGRNNQLARSRARGRGELQATVRRRPANIRRGLRHNRFCLPPRRIRRKLSGQGWNIYAFSRAGGTIHANARNRSGHRHALTVDACNGRIVTARNIEPPRKSKLKRTLRKIRKTFKKIF